VGLDSRSSAVSVDEYGSLLHPWESALSFNASHPMELSSVRLVSLVSSSDYTLNVRQEQSVMSLTTVAVVNVGSL
jgi:hypothetical protein